MVAPRCNAAYFSLSRKQCTFVGRARVPGDHGVSQNFLFP
jgi:hypothetical protein